MLMSAVFVTDSQACVIMEKKVREEKHGGNIPSTYLAYHCSSGIFVWDAK